MLFHCLALLVANASDCAYRNSYFIYYGERTPISHSHLKLDHTNYVNDCVVCIMCMRARARKLASTFPLMKVACARNSLAPRSESTMPPNTQRQNDDSTIKARMRCVNEVVTCTQTTIHLIIIWIICEINKIASFIDEHSLGLQRLSKRNVRGG